MAPCMAKQAVVSPKPDAATLAHTYKRLKEMHAKAYKWDPPEIPTAALSMRRSMRSFVRRWVNEWDLRRLYPGTELSTEVEEEMRPSYEEDDALERASSEPALIE